MKYIQVHPCQCKAQTQGTSKKRKKKIIPLDISLPHIKLISIIDMEEALQMYGMAPTKMP